MTVITSYCSYQARVDVYWRFCAAQPEADHIEEIVDKLFAALSGSGRQWTPWSAATVKAQFRERILRAARGGLNPVDEVKALRGGHQRLFEIRWQDIAVRSRDRNDRPVFDTTNARLIHAEPDELGIAMLGLVAHEKPNTAEGAAEQRRHIEQAETLYQANQPNLWGVQRRSGSGVSPSP